MRFMKNVLIGAAVALVVASTSWAFKPVLEYQRVSPTSQPTVTSPNELDEEFTDSLLYHDGVLSAHLTHDGSLAMGTRFTAPGDFQVEGIRFIATSQAVTVPLTTVNCALYTNNNNAPGTLIAQLWNGAPSTITPTGNGQAMVELLLTPDQYQTIDAGSDAWLVFANVPGWPKPFRTGTSHPDWLKSHIS